MKQSAGILVYRRSGQSVEVLLVHPGGPFWAKKDDWSIPKGELEPDEELLSGAKREFVEEVGSPAPEGELLDLGTSKSSSGKTNYVWAVEGEVNLANFAKPREANMVRLEWPPKSGNIQEFAENDRVDWFPLSAARSKVFKNQAPFLDRLAEKLNITIELPPEIEQQSLL